MKVVVETVATGLDIPWALASAPDGKLFFTERPGRVRLIEGGQVRPEPVATLPADAPGKDQAPYPEGGLLGLALDPGFPQSPFLYVMYTHSAAGSFHNRISRLRFDGIRAGQEEVLLDGIPGNQLHDGGALHFGPDGKLYASSGDAQQGDRAQDKGYLGGKILRLNADGTTPADNPFPGSPVYSFGHRNSEGFDWQRSSGALIEAEHGEEGNDEINRIVAGGNYGWPLVEGTTHRSGMISPLTTLVAAPAGASFYTGTLIPQWRGSFFVATLKGQHLRRYSLSPDGKTVLDHEVLFGDQFGRLRAVAQGVDGALYVSTSNRDRRASIQLGPAPRAEDDRILRVRPA